MAIDLVPISTNRAPSFDRFEHYQLNTGPTHEFGDLPETPPMIKNIGWTLGNDCPYRCTHCYSMNARVKGRDMTVTMVDRIVDQLRINGVETVNLGGNEPLFTNGLDAGKTLLPYIITSLVSAGIEVGLTTSGITLLRLYHDHRAAFDLLNDVDVSLIRRLKTSTTAIGAPGCTIKRSRHWSFAAGTRSRIRSSPAR